ncbi:MAG: 50S ribosomal protein L3 [Candidatus Hydrogenedentota bacterium]
MSKAILGRKLGMTRIFLEDGRWIEVTLVEAGPCTVVQRKTAGQDGYEAVQIGFGATREKLCTKPELGHFKKAGVAPSAILREFPVGGDSALKAGDLLKADLFAVGDHIDVSGITKGRGFAGGIKRHRFAGGPGGHGSNFKRAPGSIGQHTDPAKVYRGKRMPGHYGNERITVQNLEVVRIDAEKNLIAVRGALPGATGGLLELRQSVKGSK